MGSDKPHINLTFQQLANEGDPEPYVYVTKANHRVTFPDFMALDADEGAAFLRDIETSRDDDAVLKKWLSDEDYAALKDDKMTLRMRARLMGYALEYYQASIGTQGEGTASSTS